MPGERTPDRRPGSPTSGPSELRFGVVLGVGGVLGAAWSIGALSALESQTGLDPRKAEVLIGTSAGAILAALLGCGVGTAVLAGHQSGVPVEGDTGELHFDYDESTSPPRPKFGLGSKGLLLNVALHPRRATPLTALASVLPAGRGSLSAVGSLIDAAGPPGPIAWAPHPRTWVVAMDYRTGRRVVFGREGAPAARLSSAVVASCSIPAWYAPTTIGGRAYVDGGACSPTSLDLVAGLDLDVVYVLSPMTSFDYDDPATFWGRFERRIRRMVTKTLVREADQVSSRGTRVVLLGPGAEDLRAIGANMMDAGRRERVFATSLRTSSAAFAAAGLANAS